jgi:3-oxoacyl-[acyl-carrier protein] reductase
MNHLLKGQVAIVTGGNAGIGKAISTKFAEQGAHLFIFGTNSERGQETIREIQQLTGNETAEFFQVDVSNTADVDTAIKKIIEKTGRVDVLVNNAGITRDQLMMKMTEEDWDRVFAVNVKSCYNTCQSLIRSMMKARRGKIINMSSVIGLTGNIGQVNYAASKAAIIGFTKALAKEVASRNICVNCIAPGFIDTPMTGVLSEEQKKGILAQIPLGRMGSPLDIANAVLFLASGLADYVTGQVLIVDGGMVS